MYARNADPLNPEILGLLAGEYRELARLKEAGRTVRDWIRADPDNPEAYKLAQGIYEDMGALDLAAGRRGGRARGAPPQPSPTPARRPETTAGPAEATGPARRHRRSG